MARLTRSQRAAILTGIGTFLILFIKGFAALVDSGARKIDIFTLAVGALGLGIVFKTLINLWRARSGTEA